MTFNPVATGRKIRKLRDAARMNQYDLAAELNVWITNIRITKSNVKKIIKSGRLRWKIENQGFNRQKHWQGNIGHACSWNETAQKNHYLMEQIADFVKQLYEFFFLKKNGIKKLQKEISSELLASFGRQLTRTEDISSELHEAVPN